MKLKIITLLIFLTSLSASAQSIDIETCQQKAQQNYPMIRQYGLLDLMENYNLSNISKAYLPQVTLNAQATYQTDVPHLPIKVPGMDIPILAKDQYRATLDVNQLVWDGGNNKSMKQITRSKNSADKASVDVSLYAIREKVSQFYFGVLMIDEQLIQLDILEDNLHKNYQTINSFFVNGVAMQSDVDMVSVELLNTEQQKIELKSARESYVDMLSILTGEPLSKAVELKKPDLGLGDIAINLTRPELNLFDSQRKLYDAQASSIKAKNMPRLGLFAQGGYGRPGLNMLSNEFEFFAMGGIKLSWNFGGLYTQKNERNLIQRNKQLVDIQQDAFLMNNKTQQTQAMSAIKKAQDLLENDNEIISLRNRVKTASESKYKNGVYTVNDLIKDINAENQSRQTKVLHEINYLQSIYNYNTIVGCK